MTASGCTTRQFLLAAKRSEIINLKQLAVSCRLVTATSALVHELQRERGMSNIWIASGGERFGGARYEQVTRVLTAENALRDILHQLGTAPLPGLDSTRLFAGIAAGLQGLDEFQSVRLSIERRALGAADATDAFSRLIGSWLTVVFEAADVACDPDITHALVAMFNFMQGKEFAGQERAVTAAGLAEGRFGRAAKERLAHLVVAQERCFEIFTSAAAKTFDQAWQTIQASEATRELMRLRELVRRLQPDEKVPPELSEIWYLAATSRIDSMKAVEDRLAGALLELSGKTLRRAEQDLREQRERLLVAAEQPPAADPEDPMLMYSHGYARAHAEGPAQRVLFQLIRDQREHLHRTSVELAEARRALEDRKWTERAKGLLMERFGLSEEQAYRRLRFAAMSANKRLATFAEELVRRATGLPATDEEHWS